MPLISIPARGDVLQAESGENLLKVLRRNQIPVQYSCKRGECGSCKCRLESGGVDMQGYRESALPAAQRDAGLILACCSTIRGDITLGLVDSDDYIEHPQRHLVTVVREVETLTPEVARLRLDIRYVDRAGEPFVFSAGQYARLSVQDAAGTWIARDFSMASTPVDAEYDDTLEFHIRRTPSGAFSGLLGTVLVPGATVYVEGPMGSAHFRPRHDGPLLAVSAGTGLGPMLSVVKTALLNGKIDEVTLYAGFRTVADVYARASMAELASEFNNFRFHIVVEEGAQGDDRPGRVGDAVVADRGAFDGVKVYVAGSPAMVEAVSAALCARGLATRDLHADAFYAPAPDPAREFTQGV